MSRIYMVGCYILLVMNHATAFNMVNLQSQPRPFRTSPSRTAKNHEQQETNDMALQGRNVTMITKELPKDIPVTDLMAMGDENAEFISSWDPLTSLDALPNISTKEEETLLARVSETASSFMILSLGTFAVSYLLGDLLAQFEWLQDWRYFWPLIGGLYVADPMMRFWKTKGDASIQSFLPFETIQNQAIQFLSVIGGVFTLVGGAYDAFMPVWQTGPNIFTIAGIGQDGAVMLLLVTAFSIVQEIWKKQESIAQDSKMSSNRAMLQILLLAELYKLGESSVDEILSAAESISNSIIG